MKSRLHLYGNVSSSNRSRCLRMEPLERRLVLSAIPPADVDLAGPRVESVTFAEDGAYCDIAFDEAIDPATFTPEAMRVFQDGELPFEEVATFEGIINESEVVGDICYFGTNTGISIQDISAPETPVVLGEYTTSGHVFDIEIVEDTLYACGDGGLTILDISMPGEPALLGSYGTTGAGYDVAVRGSVACLAEYGKGVHILDISDPAAVTRTALATPSDYQQVEIIGDVLYAGRSARGGVYLYDISDPASPQSLGRIGELSSVGDDIEVVGDTAYIADGFGFSIWDVSVPESPTSLGRFSYQFEDADRVVTICVVDSMLYGVAEVAGSYPPAGILQAFDLTDLTEPVLVGEVSLESFGADIEAIGSRVLVTGDTTLFEVGVPISSISAQTADTFRVEFSEPQDADALTFTLQPTITDTSGNPLNQDGDTVNGESVEDLFVYPAVEIRGTVWSDTNGDGICDSGETPLANRRVFVDTSGDGAYSAGEPTATTDGDGEYTIVCPSLGSYDVLVEPEGGLRVTTSRTGIRTVRLTAATPIAEGVNIGLVESQGPRVVSTGLSSDGLSIDVTFDEAIDPATFGLTTVSILPEDAFAAELAHTVSGEFTDIAVQDGLCYVGTEHGMAVFDVRGDDAVEVGGIDLYPSAVSDWRLDVSGTIAVAASHRGIFVIDVSDPSQPLKIASIRMPYSSDSARTVALEGTTAYISCSDESDFAVVDLSDPTDPVILDFIGQPGLIHWAYDVEVVDGLAYCADDGHGLWILDVFDPTSIEEVVRFATPGSAEGIEVIGTTAFLADDGGIRIYDVSDPAAPELVGRYVPPGFLDACDIEVMGTRMFVAGRSGFEVLDVSDPGNPTRIDSVSLPGGVADLEIVGNRIVTASREGSGLRVYEIGPPINDLQWTSDRSCHLTLSEPLAQGTYSLSVTPTVRDLVGNALDQNGDGVNGAFPDDVYECLIHAGTLAGDLDGDGEVGSGDLDIVRGSWGAAVAPGDWSAGDATGDGRVNSADLDVVRANWGTSAPAAGATCAASADFVYGPQELPRVHDAALRKLTSERAAWMWNLEIESLRMKRNR